MIWWNLIWWLVTTVVGELLRPKAQFNKPQPAALGDFQVPTAEEGRAIPIIWGTVHCKGPNVVWYGDLEVLPIVEKVKTGWFSSEKVTTGYRYSLGQQLALGLGVVDELIEVRFDDKPASYSTSVVGGVTRLTFNDENLFGGDKREGGVSGAMDFYFGTQTQTANDYLQAFLAVNLPGYRRVCYAVARRMYVGTTSYLKAISFVLRRTPNQLALPSNQHNIAGDANPAAMLYDIMIDEVWGLGYNAGQIDVTKLRAIGATLFNEGLGLSMIVDTAADATDIAQDILRHMDGVIFTDLETGLITVAIARDDYVPANLLLLDESNCEDVEQAQALWPETKNVIRIEYTDRSQNFQTRLAQAQDLANIQIRNGQIDSETITFRGLSNATAANRLAHRALKTLSYPLKRFAVIANRSAYRLKPGGVFRLNWAPRGISGLVGRVNRINPGRLTDGKIRIEAVEDVFAIGSTAYAPPAGSGWVAPNLTPSLVSAQLLVEAPYHMVALEDRRITVFAARGNAIDLGYEVWSDRAGGTNWNQTNDVPTFMARALLDVTYALGTQSDDTTGIVVELGVDMRLLLSITNDEWLRGVNLLLIDGEWMAWRTITDNGDGTFTIAGIRRAVLDSIPAAHSAGAAVWFVTSGVALADDDDAPYPADLTLTARLLPYNDRGKVAISSASTVSLTTASRAQRPYPPGNVNVNGTLFPTSTTGDATLGWAHRDRATQRTAQSMVAYTAASVVATTELTSYRIERVVNGVLIATVDTGANDTTYIYTIAQRMVDNMNLALPTTLRIRARRGSLESVVQERTWTMNA